MSTKAVFIALGGATLVALAFVPLIADRLPFRPAPALRRKRTPRGEGEPDDFEWTEYGKARQRGER